MTVFDMHTDRFRTLESLTVHAQRHGYRLALVYTPDSVSQWTADLYPTAVKDGWPVTGTVAALPVGGPIDMTARIGPAHADSMGAAIDALADMFIRHHTDEETAR